MLEGILSGVLGTVLGGVVLVGLFQPRPRAFFRRCFPTVWWALGIPETAALVSPAPMDAWEKEVEGFRNDTAGTWDALMPLFERVGFLGSGAARGGLQDVVILAQWPDDPREPSGGAMIANGTLTEFCARVCARSGQRAIADTKAYSALDATRRRLTDMLRKWAARATEKGFLDWLRAPEQLDWPRRGPSPGPHLPFHARTVKLLWYMELAVAAEAGNESASYTFLSTLRDSLSAPLPMMVTGDEDGYTTLVPPES
jgi:hypothetical protein